MELIILFVGLDACRFSWRSPERSGGLGGFAESCRTGSRGTISTEKGENQLSFLGRNGTQCNEGESEERDQLSQRVEQREGEHFVEIGCALRAKPRPRNIEVFFLIFNLSMGFAFGFWEKNTD